MILNLIMVFMYGFRIGATNESLNSFTELIIFLVFISISVAYFFKVFKVVFRRGPREIKKIMFNAYLRFKIFKFLKKCTQNTE